jgi:hypothetical protein
MKSWLGVLSWVLLSGLFAVSTGCGDGGGGGEDAASDPQADADAAQDPVPDALPDVLPDAPADADAAGDVLCEFGAAFVEQFDKGCGGESDCAVVALFVDCCQTPLAAGVNQAESSRFDAAWTACLEVLDHCRCPAGPPQAEDGESAESLETILVECRSGECTTYVP